jgi:hypothetical protein
VPSVAFSRSSTATKEASEEATPYLSDVVAICARISSLRAADALGLSASSSSSPMICVHVEDIIYQCTFTTYSIYNKFEVQCNAYAFGGEGVEESPAGASGQASGAAHAALGALGFESHLCCVCRSSVSYRQQMRRGTGALVPEMSSWLCSSSVANRVTFCPLYRGPMVWHISCATG